MVLTAEELADLVPDHVGPIGAAEHKLFNDSVRGDLADFTQEETPILRADFVSWLCADSTVHDNIHFTGLRIRGATLSGRIDLDHATLNHRLSFDGCSIPEGVRLSHAQTQTLAFSACCIGAFEAKGLTAHGSVHLDNGSRFANGVQLTGARINGDLVCSAGSFESPTNVAMLANGIVVRGNMFLDGGFSATGRIEIRGARIDGILLCKDGTFHSTICQTGEDTPIAIWADRLITRGSVYLNDGFKAFGEVRLIWANVGGKLDCSNARFENQHAVALAADHIHVRGNVVLGNGFHALGTTSFNSAQINGNLLCREARFENINKRAFSGDGIKVDGDVELTNNFVALGEFYIVAANIGRQLMFADARFETSKKNAITGDGLKCGGGIFIKENFTALGQVRFIGAKIDRPVECFGCRFESPMACGVEHEKDYALILSRAVVKHDLTVRGATIIGELRLRSACIEGDLTVLRSTLENPGAVAFNIEKTRVIGALKFGELNQSPIQGKMNFRNASVGQLDDDTSSWPGKGQLALDGFTYTSFGPNTTRSVKDRLRWLGLREDKKFRSQPYEQLIYVFRKMGHDRDAEDIALAKERDFIKRGELGFSAKLFRRFLYLSVGYGYRPGRAVMILIGLLIVGWFVFGLGHSLDVMFPSKIRQYMDVLNVADLPSSYPIFEPLIYSLDVLLPFLDLHQEEYWEVKSDHTWSRWFWMYEWIHVAFGWLFAVLAVVSPTKLLRKD